MKDGMKILVFCAISFVAGLYFHNQVGLWVMHEAAPHIMAGNSSK